MKRKLSQEFKIFITDSSFKSKGEGKGHLCTGTEVKVKVTFVQALR